MREQILREHDAERTHCATYTRVMGYIRPTNSYNAGKIGEFNERVMYDEKICLSHRQK